MVSTDERVLSIFPDDGCIYRVTLTSGDSNVDVNTTITCCDNPTCACREMSVFMRPAPEASWTEPVDELSARINVDSGEIVSLTDGCTPQLRDSLAEMAKKGPFLELMRERWRRIKLLGDADAWRKLDWSWWEPGVLVRWRDAFPGEFDDIVTVDGSMFMVDDNYCCNPKCQCHDVVLSFLGIHKDEAVSPKVEPISVDVKTWRAVGQDNLPMSSMQRRLWQACAEELPDLKKTLRERHERIRGIGSELHRLANAREKKSSTRAAAKVGRNAPCPCGSGKKFKRCCGGS